MLLRRLRLFGVSTKDHVYFLSCSAGKPHNGYGKAAWFGSLSVQCKHKIEKPMKIAMKVYWQRHVPDNPDGAFLIMNYYPLGEVLGPSNVNFKLSLLPTFKNLPLNRSRCFFVLFMVVSLLLLVSYLLPLCLFIWS